jgi:hypothetical protein
MSKFYKVADLVVEMESFGHSVEQARPYEITGEHTPDIVISTDWQSLKASQPHLSEEDCEYLCTGGSFYRQLVNFDGLLLHSSAVVVDGRAYLFSGPSGMGKSTHTRLWRQLHGEDAKVFNDDKPALRCLDGVWYAYGTPWCGKDGINLNLKVPLAGICFLKRGEENSIRRLNPQEASLEIISQTIRRFRSAELLDEMLRIVERLVRDIPVFELTNKPELDAARLSYQTMLRGAKEANL